VIAAAVAEVNSGDPAGVDTEPANLSVVSEFDVGECGDRVRTTCSSTAAVAALPVM
jgi:hypothetical protein